MSEQPILYLGLADRMFLPNYLLPVEDELYAECQLTSVAQFSQFLRTFERVGKARISLDAAIVCNGKTAVQFSGRYVIHR